MEEVESPLEEIPSMVKLDTTQLGEVVFLIFGADCIVGGCREDCSCANGTSDGSAVLASDRIQDGRVESGHEADRGRQNGGDLSILYEPSRIE